MTEQEDVSAETERGAAGGAATDGDHPLLQIDGITKTFGSVISLQDISTTVRAGAVTCILGDNGAGKSTLIKILSGVYQPDEGALRMEGEQVRFTPASRPSTRTSRWCR
jgi:ABC-type sugar transport system ATPase subunit